MPWACDSSAGALEVVGPVRMCSKVQQGPPTPEDQAITASSSGSAYGGAFAPAGSAKVLRWRLRVRRGFPSCARRVFSSWRSSKASMTAMLPTTRPQTKNRLIATSPIARHQPATHRPWRGRCASDARANLQSGDRHLRERLPGRGPCRR